MFASHQTTAEMLLKAGRNVNARCVRGDTPLPVPAYHGHIALVTLGGSEYEYAISRIARGSWASERLCTRDAHQGRCEFRR